MYICRICEHNKGKITRLKEEEVGHHFLHEHLEYWKTVLRLEKKPIECKDVK